MAGACRRVNNRRMERPQAQPRSAYAHFQPITTPGTTTLGRMFLDNSDYAISYFTETGYRARPGRQQLFRARNDDTTTISKGNAVRISTSVGSQTTVVRAIANTAQAISSEVNQIIGIAVEIPFMVLSGDGAYVGFIANNYLQLVDISWIVGMVVAGGLYFVFTRSLDLDAEAGDVKHTWADTSAAQQAMGYTPRVTLREGLARQVEWHRARAKA